MKLHLYGKNAEKLGPITKQYGFSLDDTAPDVVVCYGGDGTLLHAEHAFPGVPKLPVRDSKVCKLCSNLSEDFIFENLRAGTFLTTEVMKLEVEGAGGVHWALNDITIAHATPVQAMRFTIKINGMPYHGGEEIIGDGIVAATPFGSGAYYRSITDSTFAVGIGLAFNNSTEQVDHIVLRETDEIGFTVTRGEAVIAADIGVIGRLQVGDTVQIRKSSTHMARVISFGEEFRYWA